MKQYAANLLLNTIYWGAIFLLLIVGAAYALVCLVFGLPMALLETRRHG